MAFVFYLKRFRAIVKSMARIATRAHALARAAAILALLSACGDAARDSGNDPSGIAATLEQVRATGSRSPALSPFLSLPRTELQADAGDSIRAWARNGNQAYADLRLFLGSGELSASLWGRSDYTLRLTPVDARPAKGNLVDGVAVFPDRFASTDAVVMVAGGRVEEFLLLRDGRAPNHFEWRLHRSAGLAPGVPDGETIVFRASGGKGVLRIPQVVAVDSRGKSQSATMRLEGDRLLVDLDHSEAVHPVVLDPGVESGAWTAGPSIDPVGAGPAIAYDPVRERVVLVAGDNTYPQAAGTWEYDGTGWTRVSSEGPKFHHAAMAWFPPHNKVVLHGGVDPTTQAIQSDAWEWDGTSWTNIGTWDTRYWHAMAYDRVRQRLVIHGGSPGGATNPISTTLEWDGTAAPIAVTTTGPARFAFGLVYDPASQKILCIGGQDTYNTQYQDYVWDGGTWTNLQLGIGRTALVVAVDERRKLVLADGGKKKPGDWPEADTQLFTGSAWTPLVASGAPGTRTDHAAVFDDARGNMVVVGGALSGSWLLSLHGGSCTTGAECGSGNCVDGVCCQSKTCDVCEACNLAGTEGTCAVVKGASDDTCLAPSVCDSVGNKTCGTASGQPCQSGAECVGGRCSSSGTCIKQCAGASECGTGFCVDGYCCDAACTGQCEDCLSGECRPTIGPPIAGKPTCGDGTECSSVCNGQERQSCQYAEAQKPCQGPGPSSCASNSVLQGFGCDGSGSCTPANTSCSPYRCADAACKTSCSTDSDCDTGFACAAGKCLQAGSGTCITADSVKLPDGTMQKCGLYRCSGGKCPISCLEDGDCVGGHCKAGRCRSNKQFPTAEIAAVICSHSSGPAQSGTASWMILGVVAALALARRK